MSATATSYQGLIGGALAASASGETMEVIAPATGEVVATVPRCSAEDVDRAVAAAKAAWRTGPGKTPKARSGCRHALPGVMEERSEAPGRLESRNAGNPLMASRDEMLF